MASPSITFEQVHKHMRSVDLSKLRPKAGPAARAIAPAAALPNACAAYKVVRPILVLVSSTPLLPPKWTGAIKIFIQAMDTVCPQARTMTAAS